MMRDGLANIPYDKFTEEDRQNAYYHEFEIAAQTVILINNQPGPKNGKLTTVMHNVCKDVYFIEDIAKQSTSILFDKHVWASDVFVVTDRASNNVIVMLKVVYVFHKKISIVDAEPLEF